MRNPVDRRVEETNQSRHVGAMIAEFSCVGPVLAGTDMLATMPSLALAGEIDTYGLRVLESVAAPKWFRARFVWSTRLAKDPGNIWFRNIVMDAYAETQTAANARMAAMALPLHPAAAD